jgi:hypothetical protein
MNLMFWRKKATTEDSEDDSQEMSDSRTASKQSLGRGSRSDEAPKDPDDETTNVDQARPKHGLIVVGTIVGVLVLTATGLAAWKFFLPTPKKIIAKTEAPAVVEPMPLPYKQLIKLPPIGIPQLRKAQTDNHPSDAEAVQKYNEALQIQNRALKAEIPQLEKAQVEQRQTDIDALAKRNKELQEQIDALKRKQPPSSVSPTEQTTAKDKTQPSVRSGDTAISNKNPKGAAMTVKELIDAMNASPGNSPQKPTQ